MGKIESVQSAKQVQKQSLILSSKMLTSLRIMKMSVLELREEILKEVEENIALELVKNGDLEKGEIQKARRPNRKPSSLANESIENVYRDDSSLYSLLLSQLAYIKKKTILIDLARLIIQNLDEKGFNIVPIKELISSDKKLSNVCNSKDIEDALDIVHNLYPQGCAFDGVASSLCFQLDLLYKEKKDSLSPEQKKIYSYATLIIKKDLSLLAKDEHYVQQLIKQRYGYRISADNIQKAVKLAKTLNPYPGYLFGGKKEGTQYIIPDVFVQNKENKIEIKVNISILPTIKISNTIEKLAKANDEAGIFAKNKIEEGKTFISSISERSTTLFRVVERIVVFQRDFFYYGFSFLSPLRQKDLADDLKLSNSTISRIANSKYLECKWGIFPISYFFTQKLPQRKTQRRVYSTKSYVASGYSRQACKEIIKSILKEKPISDSKIAELLSKKGIHIARRTVAKYRQELGINKSQE